MLPAEPVGNTKIGGIFRYDSSTSNLLFGYFSRDRQYLYIAPLNTACCFKTNNIFSLRTYCTSA